MLIPGARASSRSDTVARLLFKRAINCTGIWTKESAVNGQEELVHLTLSR